MSGDVIAVSVDLLLEDLTLDPRELLDMGGSSLSVSVKPTVRYTLSNTARTTVKLDRFQVTQHRARGDHGVMGLPPVARFRFDPVIDLYERHVLALLDGGGGSDVWDNRQLPPPLLGGATCWISGPKSTRSIASLGAGESLDLAFFVSAITARSDDVNIELGISGSVAVNKHGQQDRILTHVEYDQISFFNNGNITVQDLMVCCGRVDTLAKMYKDTRGGRSEYRKPE